MNILPKKSWHVRTRKNIERVQRDEAEAKRSVQIERDRILRAEHEARIRALKGRAGLVKDGPESSGTHFNLFEGCQEYQQTSNPEHEEEERQLEARRRAQAGIYNRLGRPTDVQEPWYMSSSKHKIVKPPSDSQARPHLSMYDPMTAMRQAEDIMRRRRAERKVELASRLAVKAPEPHRDLIPYQNASRFIKFKRHSSSDSSPELIKEVNLRAKQESLPSNFSHDNHHPKRKKVEKERQRSSHEHREPDRHCHSKHKRRK